MSVFAKKSRFMVCMGRENGWFSLPLSNVCPLIFVLLGVSFRINKYIELKNIFGLKISIKPKFRVTLMQLVYLHDAQPKSHLWIKHAQEKSPFINTDRAQKSILKLSGYMCSTVSSLFLVPPSLVKCFNTNG